jgi:siroheme synthase-like protein
MDSNVATNKNTLYPVFLKLEELNTLLVGAGNVGLEKLHSLLANSPAANITIIAPVVKEEVRALISQHPTCCIEERTFSDDDLNNKHLVICATDNRVLHLHIKELCKVKNLLVNVADTPDMCDLYLGSIVQKGNIKIAISTNGKSPTIAKRIKEVLADMLPDEMEELLSNMQQIRNGIKGGFDEKVRQLNDITKVLIAKNNSTTAND